MTSTGSSLTILVVGHTEWVGRFLLKMNNSFLPKRNTVIDIQTFSFDQIDYSQKLADIVTRSISGRNIVTDSMGEFS